MIVTVLQESAPTPEPVTLPAPVLTPPRTIALLVPDIQLPTAPADASSSPASSVATTEQQSPGASTPQSAATPNIETMSTVAYVQRPIPSYPRESRLAHEEGLVVLRVLIDEFGHARDIDIYRSSGHLRLDREARDAVARALFKPYLDRGVAHAAIALVPIEFSLRGNSS